MLVLLACSEQSSDLGADSGRLESRSETSRERTARERTQLAQYVAGCPPRAPIPPVARAVFDIYLGTVQATRVPTDAEVQALQRRGARVLHRFHVDAIRAELDTATARAIVTGPNAFARMVTQVQDPRQLTIPLQVFYTRAFTADDSAFLARLTARHGLSTRRPRPMVYVELPDSLVPQLLRAPGVQFAGARTFGCGYIGLPWVEPPARDSSRVPQN